jgi:hypothetical protein
MGSWPQPIWAKGNLEEGLAHLRAPSVCASSGQERRRRVYRSPRTNQAAQQRAAASSAMRSGYRIYARGEAAYAKLLDLPTLFTNLLEAIIFCFCQIIKNGNLVW